MPRRTRSRPVWEQDGLRVFAPKGNRRYYRILGRLTDGSVVDTTGGTSHEDALAAARAILARHAPGAGDRTHQQFVELLKAFSDPANHAGSWGKRHAANVQALWRNRVPRRLQLKKCSELRPGDFELLFADLRSSGYAPMTVERIGATLRAAINFGRRHGWLDHGHDPMFGVSYSAGGRSRREEQQRAKGYQLWVAPAARPGMAHKDALADAMRDVSGLDWWWLATHVAGECGLRWGELIRLTPDRVDLTGGRLLIDRQWSELPDGSFEDKLPKMDRARLVPFPEWMTDDLAARCEQVEQHHGETYASGRSKNEFRLLFSTREGRIPRRGNWNCRVITPARLAAHWPGTTYVLATGKTRYDFDWTWHSLRHLFCSHAISQDGLGLDPEVAAAVAGHTPDVFRSMYVDAPPDYLDLARSAMGRTRRPGPAPAPIGADPTQP